MATQKMSLGSSPHRKKRLTSEAEGFSQALMRSPPPVPPPLLRRLGSKEISGLGKVKVLLKVAAGGASTSLLSVDSRRRQVTLFEPVSAPCAPPEDRRLAIAAPKMFAFDAIFTDQEPKSELCATALTDIIHAVINGNDGCLFSFGHAKLGKTNTLIGKADDIGVIPSAISWLFKCISEQKQRTGSRFSVRVSAFEIVPPSHSLKDLLSQHAAECEQSPGIYLCDGAMQNFCELRAPTPEKAAFYLDSALAVRSSDQSHFFYTLHVYQYSVGGKGGVAGGRSRLHLIDLGSNQIKGGGGLPLSGVGNVLLAIFNGQKHLPHREHKLTQQLKECMGSLTCHAAMIAHVSPEASNYTDTLTTVQLASRIHRMRRKRFKFMSNGVSNTAVAGEEGKLTGSSEVDPSSSEQSADTVIYVGPTEETDGEHPPVYIPSLNSGDNRCLMSKALRGSVLDQKLKSISKSVPASPQRSLLGSEGYSNLGGRRTSSATRPNSTKSSPVRQPKPGGGSQGGTSTAREEMWIDGPKISKSRVADSRSGVHKRGETWVDGPHKNLPSAGGYGYMDSHKKSMIRKWVENQTAMYSPKPSRHYSKEISGSTGIGSHPRRQFLEESRGRASGQEDEGTFGLPTQPSLPITKVVPLEKLHCTGVEDYDEEMEVEIIEVEEPEEPVPMQDCCLQVTEEDIALCMGHENPLPEVDQEEHPLRILSQENLTVVSTFTDSLSIVNDLDRIFPVDRSTMGGVNGWQKGKNNQSDVLAKKMAQYEQLTALHELYEARKAAAAAAANAISTFKPVSRCQSLMFSELIAGSVSDFNFDVNSIASEPAYLPGETSKLCENCKVHLEPSDDLDNALKTPHTRFRSFRKLTSIASLRHPDGASNPNLRDACQREPGNGAETFRQLAEDEDELAAVPPPLHTSNMFTLTREGFETTKVKEMSQEDANNGQLYDPGGKGQFCRADVEKLERWNDTQKCTRLQQRMNQTQHKILKSEISSTRHRFFSPFGQSSFFEKRNQFQTTASTGKTASKSQAV